MWPERRRSAQGLAPQATLREAWRASLQPTVVRGESMCVAVGTDFLGGSAQPSPEPLIWAGRKIAGAAPTIPRTHLARLSSRPSPGVKPGL